MALACICAGPRPCAPLSPQRAARREWLNSASAPATSSHVRDSAVLARGQVRVSSAGLRRRLPSQASPQDGISAAGSLTKEIMEALPLEWGQVGGAGGAFTYQSLVRRDKAWHALKHMPRSVQCQVERNGAGREEGEKPMEDAGEGVSVGGGEGRVALLLEVEGVMVDLHKVGHLEAHNAAFLACGIDWARWNIATYNSLHRGTGGDPSAMLQVYFDTQRWPIDGMDAAAKGEMVLRLIRLKNEALRSAVESSAIPLRPGLVDILEEAIAAGCHVAAIAMQARCGEDTARKLLKKLPDALQDKVLVVGKEEAEGSLFWQVAVKGAEESPQDLEDVLAAKLNEAVVARKQEMAQQVAKVLKVRADVDTGGVGSQGAEGVAALRAACEMMAVPLAKVVVLAGSQGMVQVATRAGIPSIAVRSSLTSQAEFPGALQVYEDFGPGSLTVSRLLRRLGFS